MCYKKEESKEKNEIHKKTLLTPKISIKRVPLSSTKTPSVQHISSTSGPHLFSPKNPSVPPQKPLGWNWGVFGVELREVELRGFWCGTEGFWCGTVGFWELKRSGPFVWNWCVELRRFWDWVGPYPRHSRFWSPGFGIFIPGIRDFSPSGYSGDFFFVGWDIPTKIQP